MWLIVKWSNLEVLPRVISLSWEDSALKEKNNVIMMHYGERDENVSNEVGCSIWGLILVLVGFRSFSCKIPFGKTGLEASANEYSNCCMHASKHTWIIPMSSYEISSGNIIISGIYQGFLFLS